MGIGLSTYAFFWQWHETSSTPISLEQMLAQTAEWGADLLQICDYPLIESYSAQRLAALRDQADELGLGLELGTRGVQSAHLLHYLELAQALRVTLVRSMVRAEEVGSAVAALREVIGRYETAGVTLALETYEQVPTARLVEIVDAVGSPALGICLDPGNCVAALETPRQTIDLVADRVRNLHVKDFAFTRQAGWVGFTYAGARLGEGQLDLDYLLSAVRPQERGIHQIIEHWLVWQGDSASTCALEKDWTRYNLAELRSRQPATAL